MREAEGEERQAGGRHAASGERDEPLDRGRHHIREAAAIVARRCCC
jgi:hypothetical protein